MYYYITYLYIYKVFWCSEIIQAYNERRGPVSVAMKGTIEAITKSVLATVAPSIAAPTPSPANPPCGEATLSYYLGPIGARVPLKTKSALHNFEAAFESDTYGPYVSFLSNVQII